MKNYSDNVQAVCDLHDKGFTNDFQLFGNDLLWIQEGVFVRAGEFSIMEYYKIPPSKTNGEETVVFGISAPYHNIKGILLNHYKSYSEIIPPVLVRKLKELEMQNETADKQC